MRRRPASVLSLAMLLGVAISSVSVSGAVASHKPTIHPVVRGETVIHSDGIAGIALTLPESLRIFRSNMVLERSPETDFAEVRIVDPAGPYAGLCDLCFINYAEYVHDPFFPSAFYASCTGDNFEEVGCPHAAGAMRIYFASDAPVTFTLRFPQLQGSVELTATGDVDGALDPLTTTGCIPEDCKHVIYGGKARAVNDEAGAGFSLVTATYSAGAGSGSPAVNPVEGSVVPCAYPGEKGGMEESPDPADHPFGCDVVPGGAEDLNEAIFWVPRVGGNGQQYMFQDVNFRSRGSQYLGFTIRMTDTIQPSTFHAWGLWWSKGIDCPSGDFFDCDQPHDEAP